MIHAFWSSVYLSVNAKDGSNTMSVFLQLNLLLYIKHLEQCLAHTKCSTNVHLIITTMTIFCTCVIFSWNHSATCVKILIRQSKKLVILSWTQFKQTNKQTNNLVVIHAAKFWESLVFHLLKSYCPKNIYLRDVRSYRLKMYSSPIFLWKIRSQFYCLVELY